VLYQPPRLTRRSYPLSWFHLHLPSRQVSFGVRLYNTMAGFAEILIELLPTDKGGRRSPICLSTDNATPYRPHFRVRSGNGEMLGVEFVDGPDEPVAPGGSTYATVRFVYEPEACYDELVIGAEFDILEGDRVVGVGRVTRR